MSQPSNDSLPSAMNIAALVSAIDMTAQLNGSAI
jgi:fumarate hydratase class II